MDFTFFFLGPEGGGQGEMVEDGNTAQMNHWIYIHKKGERGRGKRGRGEEEKKNEKKKALP